jgi:hypothetical protein
LDEAQFHLNEYNISHNNRFWSAENPALIHEMPLSDIKVGVWCATSATRDNGPIPPPATPEIHSSTFNMHLTPFYEHLFDYERACPLSKTVEQSRVQTILPVVSRMFLVMK